MSKVGFIFPGQGAQYVGMGQALSDQYPLAKQLFAEADEALGFSLSSLCFEGPEDELKKTEITQPAILTVSVIAWRLLTDAGIVPTMVAGLSLGEYSALVAANTLSFSAAVKLVNKRGRYMQEAVPFGEGGMAAILGLDRQRLVDLCEQASQVGVVAPANFNCPGQIVIAGVAAAVDEAVRLAQEAGARRAVKLPVSAPFHTSLLESAGVRLAEDLKQAKLQLPEVPVLANVTAQPHQADPEAIIQSLVDQVSHPVLWEDCVGTMLRAGIDTFVELGPGQTLSAFARKISREARVFSVEDPQTLTKTVEALKGDAV